MSSAEELTAKYRRLAKVVTVLCWLFVAWHMFHYVYQLFVNGRLDDLTLILLEDAAPEAVVYVVKAGLIVLQLQTFATRPIRRFFVGNSDQRWNWVTFCDPATQ